LAGSSRHFALALTNALAMIYQTSLRGRAVTQKRFRRLKIPGWRLMTLQQMRSTKSLYRLLLNLWMKIKMKMNITTILRMIFENNLT